MQVNLSGSTAPQSTTNFTTQARHFSAANSASTIISQAGKSEEGSSILDCITSIPRKIWDFVQWLFCCNTTPVTVAGFLDNPDGWLRALAKDPVEGFDQLLEDLLSDPSSLITLVKTFTSPLALLKLNGKSSMNTQEHVRLSLKISEALKGNKTTDELAPIMQQAAEAAFTRLIPEGTSGLMGIWTTLQQAVDRADSSEQQAILKSYLDKVTPTLTAFMETLPTQIGPIIEAKSPVERLAAKTQFTKSLQMALLGIDARTKVNVEKLAHIFQTFQEQILPLLMGVIGGALATPSQETLPGIHLDLKKQLMGLFTGIMGGLVLEIIKPLADDLPLARIVHTHLEALLKDEEKAATFVTTLLNAFASTTILQVEEMA
ncbi:MAG: hypothetical protein K940chlam2_01419 [Chlamydiae bacterium]|nr:hypothetical protein [Chlamydiota bacterium]